MATTKSDIRRNLNTAIRYAEYALVNAERLNDNDAINRLIKAIAAMQTVEETVK